MLEALDVENNDIGAPGCVALSKSTWQNLIFLDISNNFLGNIGVEHLMKADWPLLKTLCMQAVGLKEDCKVLANSNWSELTRLHLGQNGLNFKIDEIAPQGRLERLDLSENCVYSSGTHPMGYHGWGSLKRLCLCGTEGTYTDERPPTAVCNMLEYLDLSSCGLVNVDSEGHKSKKLAVENLLSACWPMMQFLKLAYCDIGSVSMERVVSVGCNWPLLTVLDLHGNKLDSAAVSYLVTGDWPVLQALDLSENNLDERSIHILIEAHPWPRLEELHLDDFQLRLLQAELTKSSFEFYPDSMSELDKAEVAQLARRHWPRLKHFKDTGPLDFSVSDTWLQFW